MAPHEVLEDACRQVERDPRRKDDGRYAAEWEPTACGGRRDSDSGSRERGAVHVAGEPDLGGQLTQPADGGMVAIADARGERDGGVVLGGLKGPAIGRRR